MQKQVNFFEQNVQWFALGLGGLFLLWMVFSYVIQPPVKVSVGGNELGPGEVDVATLEGPVTQLKKDIAQTSIPEIPIVDYVPQFVNAIGGESQKLPQLSPFQIASVRMLPGEVTPGLAPGEPGDAPVADATRKPIEKLPKPPAARPVAHRTGRSEVTYQDPAWEPRPNRPNDPPAMITEDKDWWSGAFVIPAEALVKAFTDVIDDKRLDAANLDPALFFQTAVLDVELVRREILPGNKAGKEQVIAPLKNNLMRPPFPGKNAKDFEINEYLNWATQSPPDVLTPVFYEITAGDSWEMPGEANERMAAMTAEQRRQARQQRIEQQRMERQQRNQQNAARRGMPPMGGEMMDEGMGMGMEEGMMIPPPPPPRGFGAPGAFRGPGGPGAIPPRRFGPGVGAQPVQPAQPMQAGKNDVRVLADIQIVAHDDTIQPGKTYQYKIRYRILNPVFKSNAAPPELANQFAIVSVDSPWTEPVRMRSKVEFFLANAANEKGNFDVFQWDKGQMRKTTVSAAAGDAIGATGFSVVDVRRTGRKPYVLLVDENGIVSRREPEGGNESDRYLELLDEVELNNPQVGMRQ